MGAWIGWNRFNLGETRTLTSDPNWLQEVPADQSASQRQECLVDVGSLFIAHAQAAKLIKPRKSPFNYPAMPTQDTAMFSVSLREQGPDPSNSQTLPDRFRVITTVANHAIRSIARPAAFALQVWNGVNKR